jgi:predicted AAA+ superfamily ATPase
MNKIFNGIEFLMELLGTITEEYLGGLAYSKEIKRNFSIPRNVSDIVAITGPRRAGKTFCLL